MSESPTDTPDDPTKEAKVIDTQAPAPTTFHLLNLPNLFWAIEVKQVKLTKMPIENNSW